VKHAAEYSEQTVNLVTDAKLAVPEAARRLGRSAKTLANRLGQAVCMRRRKAVSFSVPEDIRREFNQLFEKENKSAILTRLIMPGRT